ncbi:nickel transport protein [Rhodoblastus acidophilus]|uniref:cobalamin biosynthesis protein CbiM n=1 Tax=Rhodoblastus acidophilus TaxID=1074 RepID=UPI00222472CC|nr:cobalamin biosynthesis protein CbiM [Rhodoblastus acidophilus]MCW2317253.1 nickel transport protein [Rhodoblastus acidophilus]
MSARRLLPLALLLTLGLTTSASAHRLKLFLTVEDGALGGYAFFVGGGWPSGADVIVKQAGREVYRGKTGDHGDFRWKPPAPADYSVTIDAGDGHWVEGVLTADRLGGAEAPSPPVETAPPPQAAPACAPTDAAAQAKQIEAQVDRAVARQLRPLLEAYDQAEGRVRFNDVMGGIGMIVGLAGAGLWASARRPKRRDDGHDD